MKNLNLLILSLLIGIFGRTQTLTKIVSEPTGFNQIGIYNGDPICSNFDGTYTFNFYQVFPLMDYNTTPSNDIYQNELAINTNTSVTIGNHGVCLGNDNQTISYNGYTYSTNWPTNIIATDGDTIYALYKTMSGLNFNILKIHGNGSGSLGWIAAGTNFGGNFDESPVNNTSDMDYFEYGGTRYISFIGDQNLPTNNILSFYNLDNSTYYKVYKSGSPVYGVNSVTYFNEELFIAIGDKIYKVQDPFTTSMSGTDNIININYTLVYNLEEPVTINEFEFYSGFTDTYIYVAASNGLYSNFDAISGLPSTSNYILSNLVNQLGTDEITETFNVELYPNPNNGKFTIQGLKPDVMIAVTNSNGQIIQTMFSTTMDAQEVDLDVPPGIYYIKITDNESTQIKKFIIQ